MTASLEGRAALVTGAATGIGQAIAISLAERGADVAITYLGHNPTSTLACIRRSGRRGLAVRVDPRDSSAVTAAVDQAASELGHLEILVNNAGGLVGRQELSDMSDDHWREVLDVNLSSAFYFTRASLRHLSIGGRIVSVSSLAARNGGGPGASAYAASKAGLHGLTRALAKELAPRGMTVNAVDPGFIGDTPFHERFTSDEARESAIAATPLRRAGTSGDVAAAVAYLVSDDAAYCTGVLLDINGGSYFT